MPGANYPFVIPIGLGLSFGVLRLLDHVLHEFFLIEVGIELEQLLPGGDGSLGVILGLVLDDAQVHQCAGMFRVVGQRLLQFGDGSVAIAGEVQAGGEVGPHVRILRVGLQRLLEVVFRFLELVSALIEHAEVIQGRGIVRVVLQLGQQRLGLFVGHALQVVQRRHLLRAGCAWHAGGCGWRFALREQPEALTAGAEPRRR